MENVLLIRWQEEKRLVRICPEVAGGMKVPRPSAQIMNDNGLDVLKERAGVIEIEGRDVTDYFLRGAEYVLSIVMPFMTISRFIFTSIYHGEES